MKIPFVMQIDADQRAKAFVNRAIETFGKSRNINELALTVHCVDDVGTKFDIVQFHRTRSVIHFLSGE